MHRPLGEHGRNLYCGGESGGRGIEQVLGVEIQLETDLVEAPELIEQALTDNSSGSNIVLVLHGAPLRIALAHYLGMPLAHYPRLRAAHGSVSVLRFTPDYARCDVLVINGGLALQQAI